MDFSLNEEHRMVQKMVRAAFGSPGRQKGDPAMGAGLGRFGGHDAFDQAALSEQGSLKDPASFVTNLNSLLSNLVK